MLTNLKQQFIQLRNQASGKQTGNATPTRPVDKNFTIVRQNNIIKQPKVTPQRPPGFPGRNISEIS